MVKNGLLKNCILILIIYPTIKDDNNKNLSFFMNASNNMLGYENIFYERKSYANDLHNVLKKYIKEKRSNIIFDISTCSSYVFYPTMVELMKFDIYLTIVYTEAKIYFPIETEWEKVKKEADKEVGFFIEAFESAKFLSDGVEEIYAYSPFSEFNPGNKSALLIALPNFSAKRMNAIIDYDKDINKTSYENIIWLVGEPPAEKNNWRIEGVKRTNNLSNQHTNVKLLSTFDYKDTIKILENIWSDNKYKYHISIGTLGSKMQHLGTFFFINLHKDIGLILAEPKEYNAGRFSSGCNKLWEIKFGSTKEINNLLNNYLLFKWKL